MIRRSIPARIAYHAGPLALIVVLTILLCAPLVANLTTAVPGWEGDNLFYVRSMWWMKHALVDLGISPFLDPSAYFPVGRELARGEMTASNTVLGVPLTAMWGPVVSYNVVLLLSFVFTGWGSYFWVTHLTGRRSAGVIAGVVFAFAPYRFAHMVGHLPQMTTHWVPWMMWAFERFLARRTAARGALVGVFAALVVIGCWYYGHSTALMFPLYVLWRTRGHPGIWRDAAWWGGITAAVVVAGILVGPFLLQVMELRGAGTIDRSLREMDAWSMNPYDFFIPNLLHPLWGDVTSPWFPEQRALWVERGVSLGFVAAIAALAGAVLVRPRRLVGPLVALWIASALIALGPTLHMGDRQVRIAMPQKVIAGVDRVASWFGPRMEPLRQDMRQSQDLPIPLPSFLLYFLVPFTSGMRAMTRFAMWTSLATGALAAWGALALGERAARRWGAGARGAVPAMILAGVVVESMTVFAMMKVEPRPVDLWLRTQADVTVIADLPAEESARPFQDYWATVHGKATIISWNGDSFWPPTRMGREEAMRRFPAPDSIAFLGSLGTTHLLVTASRYPDWPALQRALEAEPQLTLVDTIGGVWIYRIRR
jgi:hypothetical protein